MTAVTIGVLGFAALFALLALRVPIGVAMLLVGVIGSASLIGLAPALASLGTLPLAYSRSYDLSVIPFFVFMGSLCTACGASRDFYNLAYAWVGHWRGGLASATVLACSGFAAVSGSSVATAVTMGSVALPQMREFHYDARLATGCIAAGGTLGILIPPSTGFVVYALLTEQSIGRLFLAGIFPGLLLTVLFIVTIYLLTRLRPAWGPAGPVTPWPGRVRAVVRAAGMIAIAVISIGGIYLGVFTPSEAAAVGAFLAVVLCIWRSFLGNPTRGAALTGARRQIADSLLQTMRTTAMVFLILIGAQFFTPFLALSGIPGLLAESLSGLQVPPQMILFAVIALYIVLGMFLDGFAMLVLTMPIVFPIVTGLGYDPIWFGVIVVILLEMGLITPPVGINVFVVKGLADDIPMRSIFVGVLPFWIAMVLCTGLLIAFPEIALFLPQTMIR